MIPLFKQRRLYVIFSITIIAVMGVASITPALPKMAEALELSQSEIGWMISVFTLPGVFLTPITGIIADRFGRKKVLFPSLLLFAVAGFSLYFVSDFKLMLLFRFMQGIGAASLPSLNTTLIGDFYHGKERPAAMGYNASVLSMATASYPLIGGLMAGIGWNFPFLLPLLAIPVAFFLYFGIKEPAIKKPTSIKQYFRAMGQTLFDKEIITIFILGIFTFIIMYGAFITYLPFLLHEKFALSAPQIGLMASIGSLASIIVATQIGKLTQRVGSITLLKIAFILYIIVNIVFPYLNLLFLFIVPILLFGTAQALNMPSLQTMLANKAPDHLRGAFMSLNGMNLRLGQTLGPLIIGLGYTFYGLKGGYLLISGIGLVGLIMMFLVFNRNSKKNLLVSGEK